MRRYPFRGIYTEVAKEEGVTPEAIRQAVKYGNPRILEKVAGKIEERRAKVRRYNDAVA